MAEYVQVLTTAGSEEEAEGIASLLLERRLERARDASVADALVEQEYLGRTFAFSGDIDRAIEALTPVQVSAVARKYVKPDAFAYVFAGDFTKKK